MRRSSSIVTSKENPRFTSSFVINKSQSQETDSFCYDKLESVHFESQELQAQIESLISKMKNDGSVQNTYKTEQGFIKVKKDDFVFYYTQLKDIYKAVRKLFNHWDGLFDDFSTKHNQTLAKKSKEVESLNNHYKYKLKALEFEKKSALEAQKSDLLRREQEVLDAVNNFLNSLKATKKTWNNNLTELQFCVQEQAQNLNYLSQLKNSKLKAFSNEIDSIFTDLSPIKGMGPISTERNRQPFTDLINNLSPINKGIPKIGMQLLNKSKDDSQIQSSKRGKDMVGETTADAIDELFAFNKNNGIGNMQENSRLSPPPREKSGWDTNLEDEESMESPNIDQIEKALELLFQNGLLDQQAVNVFDEIMQKTNESGLDREIQMNLFKDHIKLELKRQSKNLKNQDLPLVKTNKLSIIEEISRPESALRRKTFGETSTTGNPKFIPEDMCQTPSQIHDIQIPRTESSNGKKSDFKKVIPQADSHFHRETNGSSKYIRKIEDMKRNNSNNNKNDISLSDLLKVREYSFVLESPLSTHMVNLSREDFHMSVPRLQHVNKEDLLKAESLPITMKEVELSKIMPDKLKDLSLEIEASQTNFLENTRKKDQINLEEKQRKNQGEIKIIEEFKNSLNNLHEIHADQREDGYESSDRSSPHLSSQKRRLLHEDDTQLEWESNMDIKGHSSKRTKTLSNLSLGHPNLVSTTTILKDGVHDIPSESFQETGTSQEGASLALPPNIKDIRSRTSTINSVDIKLFPIEASRKAAQNRSELVKGNPIRRIANKSSLRNSHFTGSGQTRISTKANTRFNEAEGELTHHMPLTMFTSLNHTEPLRLADKHNFSHMVETEADAEDKIAQGYLNSSFPPYWQHEKDKKEVVIKFPTKRNPNYTYLKTVETENSGWGSKNLIPHGNSGNFQSFTSLRASKGFSNQRSRSDTSVWTKAKNLVPETDKLFAHKAPKKFY